MNVVITGNRREPREAWLAPVGRTAWELLGNALGSALWGRVRGTPHFMRVRAVVFAAIREVHEETACRSLPSQSFWECTNIQTALVVRLSPFFRVNAPDGLPNAWQHVVTGEGEDATLVFDCRFDPSPKLWPVQAVFLAVE